jgi:MFS family permease
LNEGLPYPAPVAPASRFAARLLRVPAPLVPVVLLSLASSLALSLRVDFMGIWAVSDLKATATGLGLAYVVNAVLEAPASVAAGWLVSRVSRRVVYVGSALANAAVAMGFLAAGNHAVIGLVLITIGGATDAFGWVALSVALAGLAAQDELDAAYAAQRVASSAGLFAGPLLAGALLTAGWPALWAGAACCAVLAALAAARAMPASHAASQDKSGAISWRFLSDTVFVRLFIASALGYLVLFAYEIVFPITFVADRIISASRLAFFISINPLLALLLQTTVTRFASRWPYRFTLLLGPLAMAAPVCILIAGRSIDLIIVVLAAGAVGEMIWSPAASAVAARHAPAANRGPYLGTLATAYSFGIALAPVAGLSVRARFGSHVLYLAVAATGLASGLIYAGIPGSRHGQPPGSEMSE